MTNPKDEVPWTNETWEEYTSNSYSRIGTADGYQEVIYAVTLSDGCATVQFRSPEDKALVIESPAMAALLEAIDKSWAEYWPEGPDVKHGTVNIADDTAVIWRGIRESLARIGRGK